MIVEDFICLGRTVPEDSKRYGHKVCMAGYSAELDSLMRVYPLPVVNPLKVRSEYVLALSRPSTDSRKESWKLTDRIALYHSDKHHSTDAIVGFLSKHVTESISELNDRRVSLGVIQPECVRGFFVNRKNADPTQQELFEATDKEFGANAVNVAPYLEFKDGSGWHKLQLREWGCYEWIRRNPGNCTQLWKNLSIDNDRKNFLLVGNMTNRRNVWLVIKTFSVAVSIQPSLLEGLLA